MVTWSGGQDVVASVVAHEIGHNLGLSHLVASLNLMQASGPTERLDTSQVDTVLSSRFVIPILTDPADFSGDGVVGHNDLSNWTTGFGIASNADPSDGDADGDRDVEGQDFLLWQRAYDGNSAVSAVSILTGATAVPEPSTLVLLSVLLSPACCRQRNGSSAIF